MGEGSGVEDRVGTEASSLFLQGNSSMSILPGIVLDTRLLHDIFL